MSPQPAPSNAAKSTWTDGSTKAANSEVGAWTRFSLRLPLAT